MKKSTVLVIDGQGGKLGSQIISILASEIPVAEIIAIGTNGIASANMMKAGPDYAATGENAVIVACRKADIIIGPIGIVIADSMYGELTPAMALAIAQADAHRLLIPVNRCNNFVAGLQFQTVAELIDSAVKQVKSIISLES